MIKISSVSLIKIRDSWILISIFSFAYTLFIVIITCFNNVQQYVSFVKGTIWKWIWAYLASRAIDIVQWINKLIYSNSISNKPWDANAIIALDILTMFPNVIDKLVYTFRYYGKNWMDYYRKTLRDTDFDITTLSLILK